MGMIFEEPWWYLKVEQCKVNFVVFYFLQLCCPCDHFQVFVGFAIFNFMMCRSFDGCVACGEHWSRYVCVCCFVICMQVWVFKSFNYFLLPFPISLIFLVYYRLIVNSTHFVHFFPFYPFLSISIHCVQYCPFLSILSKSLSMSIFIYCLFCQLYLLQVNC
jgi:hypothetical protein